MTTKSLLIDRRAFLSGAGLTVGAVVATSLVPLSVVHALPASVSGGGALASSGSWHVDDICGHWPPYSHAIGYGRAPLSRPAIEGSSIPVDHIYLM